MGGCRKRRASLCDHFLRGHPGEALQSQSNDHGKFYCKGPIMSRLHACWSRELTDSNKSTNNCFGTVDGVRGPSCRCVCGCACVHGCVTVGDGCELVSKDPGGHGEAGLDRRGPCGLELNTQWGSTGETIPPVCVNTPGSRRVPKSPCTPFPCSMPGSSMRRALVILLLSGDRDYKGASLKAACNGGYRGPKWGLHGA